MKLLALIPVLALMSASVPDTGDWYPFAKYRGPDCCAVPAHIDYVPYIAAHVNDPNLTTHIEPVWTDTGYQYLCYGIPSTVHWDADYSQGTVPIAITITDGHTALTGYIFHAESDNTVFDVVGHTGDEFYNWSSPEMHGDLPKLKESWPCKTCKHMIVVEVPITGKTDSNIENAKELYAALKKMARELHGPGICVP